jgi:hypothetical protein
MIMKDIKELIESSLNAKSVLKEMTINEVTLTFDKGEKQAMVIALNNDDKATVTATMKNLTNFKQWHVMKVLQKEIDNIPKDVDNTRYERYLTKIINKIEKLKDRERVLLKSKDGVIVSKEQEVSKDRSGPYSTTGTSIIRYSLKSRLDWDQMENWLDANLAKSGYLVDRKYTNLDLIKRYEWTVDISTTVWYN